METFFTRIINHLFARISGIHNTKEHNSNYQVVLANLSNNNENLYRCLANSKLMALLYFKCLTLSSPNKKKILMGQGLNLLQ